MSDRQRRQKPVAQRTRPKLRNQVLFVLGLFLLAGGAFYAALVVAVQVQDVFFPGETPINLGVNLPGLDKAPDHDESAPAATELGGGRINVLVMGLDKRARESYGRTDTMFVVTIDPSTKTSRGLAIPRDLWVDIPSKTGNTAFKERVNAAYVVGESQGYAGGGPALAKATVERLLGMKIQYYVVVDFDGFKQVVDLLGGIDIDNPSLVSDPFYSETEVLNDFYPCVFQPGVHHLNGSDALCYSRVRRNSSDLDRIQRQQRVIFAIIAKASQLHVLAEPKTMVKLYDQYKNFVRTDINDLQIPGFANLAKNMDPDRLAFLQIGPATTPWTTPQGAAVLLPSESGIKQIVAALLSDAHLEDENAVVEVQADKPDKAKKAADYVTSLGISQKNVVVSNVSAPERPVTEIIDFTGKRYTAERVAAWLNLPKDRVRVSTDVDLALRTNAKADILLIVGEDAKMENTAVLPTGP